MSLFTDFLQGIPVNGVLRERVLLAEQKFKDLEERAAALAAENATLRNEIEKRTRADAATIQKPQVQWGCYVFEGDENLYCPACYDTKQKKCLTTRINSRFRRCSACRTELGSS